MHEAPRSLLPALLSIASLAVLSAACGLLPSVSVYPTNTNRDPEYKPLPNATAMVPADKLAAGTLKPFCEVRGGKIVRHESALAKVTGAVAEWRRVNKEDAAPARRPFGRRGPEGAPRRRERQGDLGQSWRSARAQPVGRTLDRHST